MLYTYFILHRRIAFIYIPIFVPILYLRLYIVKNNGTKNTAASSCLSLHAANKRMCKAHWILFYANCECVVLVVSRVLKRTLHMFVAILTDGVSTYWSAFLHFAHNLLRLCDARATTRSYENNFFLIGIPWASATTKTCQAVIYALPDIIVAKIQRHARNAPVLDITHLKNVSVIFAVVTLLKNNWRNCVLIYNLYQSCLF